MNKLTKRILLLIGLVAAAFAFTGCQDNNVEDAADEMGDAMENAGDNVKDAVEEAGDNIENATD